MNAVRFTRRDIRHYTQWSDNQLKVHCQRLADMEYLLVHGGSRGHLLQYELLWNGDKAEEAHLCGLIEPENQAANSVYDSRKSGPDEGKSGSSLPQVGAKSGSPKPAASRSDKGLNGSQVGRA
ncbi:hypothetical protein [Photorhabdus bodei]|uniref:hypothetical protein n=1 Tax=Photorhabdus bodei TaxID=2029681 RepID=UPI001EE41FB7|nr:hypothetical protein [Photorhabdus bodei]